MNVLENYIEEVHSEEDVTKLFEEKAGYTPEEPIYKVDLTCDCYGRVERGIRYFRKIEWEDAQKKGYFLA